MPYEVVDDDLLLGVLLVLVADPDVQSHHEGAHQAALAQVPECFGGVAGEGLEVEGKLAGNFGDQEKNGLWLVVRVCFCTETGNGAFGTRCDVRGHMCCG